MKKVILGLFLTVGSSSLFFANVKKNEVVKESQNFIFSQDSQGCSTSTITNYVDKDGNLIKSEQSAWLEISCGGAPDGTTVIKSRIVMERK